MTGVESLDGFGFFECVAAETKLDLHRDVLAPSFLQFMAEKYAEGRIVLDGHRDVATIGRTFDAYVQASPEDGEVQQLIVKFYLSPNMKTVSGANPVQVVSENIADRVSVGFSNPYIRRVAPEHEDEKGYWIHEITPEMDLDRIHVMELSIVYYGAQPGAKIKGVKGQNAGIDPAPSFGLKPVESTEKSMSKITYHIKSINKDVEIEKSILGIIKEIDNEAADAIHDKQLEADGFQKQVADLEREKTAMQKRLDKFEESEGELKELAITNLVNLQKMIKPDLNVEEAKKAFEGMSRDQVNAQIEMLKALKPDQLKPDTKPTKTKSTVQL